MTITWKDITWALWDFLRDVFRTKRRKLFLFLAIPLLALGLTAGCHSTSALTNCSDTRPNGYSAISWGNHGTYATCRWHNYVQGRSLCGWVRYSDHAHAWGSCGTPS